jgi:hypothetical protein
MSAADARTADAAFALLPRRPKTRAEREAEKRRRERQEYLRLVDAIRRRMSLQANVSDRDLLSEGFDPDFFNARFARAAREAGAHGMAA